MPTTTDYTSEYVKKTLKWIGVTFVALVATIVLVLFCMIGFRTIGRAQARADAHNQVSISGIEIQNQAQRILVAKQKAEIRRQDAIGVREAQTEIAKTLTPLYVQFEMVEALKAIAVSGRNNSVVYIPAGANGIPLIADANPNKVGQP